MEKHASGLVVLSAVLFLLVGFLFGGIYGSETVTKEVEVEIERIVEIETIVEVEVPANETDYLGNAVSFFWDELEDEDDLLECDEQSYDSDDIELSRLFDAYSINFDEEDYSIDFQIKLTYDEDDSPSCRNTWDVNVFYEEDEDAVLTYA